MFDPIVAMTFAVYSNKGAYALLLGSGISRASGIPTGWEVVIDLIRKSAKVQGVDCEPDPAAWFKSKFGLDPDYSKLLDSVAKTPAERQQLLRAYFEPTEEERTQGLKLPSAAHKAIAKLVSAGYVKVIITTNFDRLMEGALEEIGISPTVISNTDQINGALPLTHAGATIIKLHGDYLDVRIKNTELELSEYDDSLNKLLDRVIDEYGLIISGWSGDWDAALRSAIERCPSRRFTTFWTTRSQLSERGKRLAAHRSSVVVSVKDSNFLFESLFEKVQSLEDISADHPLSAKMAVATVKRYLVDSSSKIRLRDMVHEETEKIYLELDGLPFSAQLESPPNETLKKRLQMYESLCDVLLSMIVTGCYWGNHDQSKLWTNSLQRLGNTNKGSGYIYLIQLRRYPVLLLFYGAGIAAIAAGNYQTLAEVFTKPKVVSDDGRHESLCSEVYPLRVIETEMGQSLPGLERRYTPASDYLFGTLRNYLREYLPRDEDYQEAFDRFEYLLGLVHADFYRREVEGGWWGPVGCFGWRGRRYQQEGRIGDKIGKELDEQGENWPLLKSGFFRNSLVEAKLAKAKFDTFLKCVRFY